MTVDTPPVPGREWRGRDVAVVLVAVVMQIVVAVPFTVALGLLAPAWGIAVAWSLWLAGVAALITIARRRPLLAPVVPVVNAGLLFVLVTVGESLLGWTP
jgi:hypothetical protein